MMKQDATVKFTGSSMTLQDLRPKTAFNSRENSAERLKTLKVNFGGVQEARVGHAGVRPRQSNAVKALLQSVALKAGPLKATKSFFQNGDSEVNRTSNSKQSTVVQDLAGVRDSQRMSQGSRAQTTDITGMRIKTAKQMSRTQANGSTLNVQALLQSGQLKRGGESRYAS